VATETVFAVAVAGFVVRAVAFVDFVDFLAAAVAGFVLERGVCPVTVQGREQSADARTRRDAARRVRPESKRERLSILILL